MTGPPLDVARLVALLVASEDEVDQVPRGAPMPAAAELQMELWLQRRAIVAALIRSPRRRPTKGAKPPKPANDPDQLDMF